MQVYIYAHCMLYACQCMDVCTVCIDCLYLCIVQLHNIISNPKQLSYKKKEAAPKKTMVKKDVKSKVTTKKSL